MPSLSAVCILLMVLSDALGDFPASPMYGGSTRAREGEASVLKSMGGEYCRVYGHWKYIEPKVMDFDPTLTVAKVRANPKLVEEWAAKQNWAELDRRMDLVAKAGLVPVLEVGEGSLDALPTLNGTVFDPDVVGEEPYLAYQYRYSRATVERYKGRVRYFQVENELNEAWLAGAQGQRRFQMFGSSWRSMDFLTRLLTTLVAAVKEVEPDALVTTNLHTDVFEWVHKVLNLPGFYVGAAKAWAPLLDFMALDAYPNMVVAEPCLADMVGDRVGNVSSASGGKPVVVMETSYTACAGKCTDGPLSANFTEAHQAECGAATFAAAAARGGRGFMWFMVSTTPGLQPPPGGYNEDDVSALKMIATLYQQHENPLVALAWLASPKHIKYLESGRLGKVLAGLGDGFGVMRPDGTLRPVFDALKRAYTGGAL